MILINLRKTTQCALSESECAAKKTVINKAMNDFITANDDPQSATKLGEHLRPRRQKHANVYQFSINSAVYILC